MWPKILNDSFFVISDDVKDSSALSIKYYKIVQQISNLNDELEIYLYVEILCNLTNFER